MVAIEYRTGRKVRLWLDGEPAPAQVPFDCGPDSLFVAFFASAEMGCFLALGWPLPIRVMCLYAEFRRYICGRDDATKMKPSLLYALDWFGLESIAVTEQETMRQLAIAGGPYTDAERLALLDYCETDSQALIRLLPRMLPYLDLPRAVLRGEFVKAVAHMEHNGIPIDAPILAQLEEHWESLQTAMARRVDAGYGVFDGIHFRTERFARYLARNGIAWPRLLSGELALDKETFRDMAKVHPELEPLRQLLQALALFRLADLPVGVDGRNRCRFSPFGTITGRCAPSTSDFIFARPAWMRSLIRPEQGRALAHIDWSSQEYGIGAALSGDGTMLADYTAGDPYLGFAKRINMVPQGATKRSHHAERTIIKSVILGTQYGMGEVSLAVRIGKPVAYARDLLQAHRRTYPKFWAWSEAAVSLALFRGRLWTRFGWQVQAGADPNPRSLSNFPCQANTADMLRLAAVGIVDAGVQLDATIHDAVLIEADAEGIDAAIDLAQRAMDRASELVLYGFRLRTDTEVIAWPERYRDGRGAAFFDSLLGRLAERQGGERRARQWAYW